MIPVNPSRGAAFRSTSTSVGFLWDGGNERKTLTLITTPLAGAQLALLLEQQGLDEIQTAYPQAYQALKDIKEILDDLLSGPIPTARRQWAQLDREQQLKRGMGIDPEMGRTLGGD